MADSDGKTSERSSTVQSGYGTGADSADAADLWVRDPRTGEYRMRLPGEPVPQAPAPAPAPAARAAAGTAPAPSRSRQPSPGQGPGAPASRRAPRRRERQRSGPWIAAAACFVLAVGGGGYLLLHQGGGARTGAVGGGSPTQPVASCSPRPGPSGTGGTAPEPAVSGAFLQGAKATAINVRVTVLNGSGTIGQAETLLTWLQSSPQGFLRSSNGGPAALTARTTLVYAADHVDQARTLAAVLRLPASSLHGDGKTSGTIGRMVLTLGQDYRGIGRPFAAPSPAVATTTGTQAACGSQ